MKWSRQTVATVMGLALVGVVIGLARVPAASSQALTVRAVQVAEAPVLDPDWRLWAKVPGVDVPITAQNLAYPIGGGSVTSVNLRAVHYEGVLYIRAAWQDRTEDTHALSTTAFSDAVALEFPARSAVMVPSFCMGQANAGVNIWQWRADSQAGGPDVLLGQIYPNAFSDGYPEAFEKDPIYQPARALNNPVAPAERAVQNLVAQAFGALAPAALQEVDGTGRWRDGEWQVVFARPFAGSAADQAEFRQGTRTNLAVAIWNGSEGDRAGQKAVSQFVTLDVSPATLREGTARDWSALWLGLLIGGSAIVFGLLLLFWSATGGARRTT